MVGKILSRVFLNRLNAYNITPKVVPESQCGFRSGRSMIDMVFCLRQIQDKCIEQTMLEVAISDIQEGVYIQTRKEADLLNVANFQIQNQISL